MPASTRVVRASALRWLGLLIVVLAISPAVASQAATPSRASHTPARAFKACSMLTKADLNATLGGTTSSKAGSQGAFSVCTYKAHGRGIEFLIADQASIKAKSAYTTTAGYWHATINYTSKKQTVKGLGNAAIWFPQLGQLWVLKGTTMFSVSEFPVRQDSLSLLTRMAKRVLSHL
jgi:hypothetical protein